MEGSASRRGPFKLSVPTTNDADDACGFGAPSSIDADLQMNVIAS
jgi:hypothetical protein